MAMGASAAETRRGAETGGGRSRLGAIESLTLSDGRALCVRRWAGSEPGTLVVLHGLLDSSEGWSCLSDGVTCSRIAFDLPGFGHSDPPARGSIAGYARDVAEGLALLGIERFTLVGHSLGGGVATALAELVPDRVAALVLLAPVGFGRIHLAEAAAAPGIRNVVHAALPAMLSSRLAVTTAYVTMVTNGKPPDRDVLDRLRRSGHALVQGAREGTRAVGAAGRSSRAFHRRRVGYHGPVLAVWGDRDRLVPASHRHGVLSAFPDACIQIWRGMGHHPLHERFDELADLITDVVAKAERPPAEQEPLASVA